MNAECLDCGAPTLTGLCVPCARVAVTITGSEQARIDQLTRRQS